MTGDAQDGQGPEFGPGGYLPQRAAKRARKIVLRGELGIQWVVASILAGVLLLVAGVLWLGSADDVPDGFVPVAAVTELERDGASMTADGLIVLHVDGRLRAFAAPDPSTTYCEANGRIEAHVGSGVRVYSVTGRALAGGASLTPYPVVIVDGTVYAGVERPLPEPAGANEDAEPACLSPAG